MQIMNSYHLACVLAATASLPQLALTHTWAEAVNVIDSSGTLIEPNGYQRSFVPRNATDFRGDETQQFNKLETNVNTTGQVCASFQQKQQQSEGYPVLTAYPGAKVAIRYAENGHVTIEEAGRPAQGGPVWIYGTTDGANQQGKLLKDVRKWTKDGKGGDKTGQLLTTQVFDDGRCYEQNPSSNSAARQAAAPLPSGVAPPLVDYGGLECQNNFMIPADAPIGKLYTIYWVWDFSKVDGSGPEWFTTCLDIDITAPKKTTSNKSVQRFNSEQPVASAAVAHYFTALVASGDASVPTTGVVAPNQVSSSAAAAQVPAQSPSAPQPTAPAANSVPGAAQQSQSNSVLLPSISVPITILPSSLRPTLAPSPPPAAAAARTSTLVSTLSTSRVPLQTSVPAVAALPAQSTTTVHKTASPAMVTITHTPAVVTITDMVTPTSTTTVMAESMSTKTNQASNGSASAISHTRETTRGLGDETSTSSDTSKTTLETSAKAATPTASRSAYTTEMITSTIGGAAGPSAAPVAYSKRSGRYSYDAADMRGLGPRAPPTPSKPSSSKLNRAGSAKFRWLE